MSTSPTASTEPIAASGGTTTPATAASAKTKEPVYEGHVTLARDHYLVSDTKSPVRYGMTATADIVRSLLLRESDLGLSLHDPEHSDIQCQVLVQGKLQLLAPHGWLQPKQKYISLQDLAGQAMVGLEGQDPLSPALENKLQALRPAPSIQTRVQTHQMMRSMVEAGEGLAIVDPFTALGARPSGLDVCPLSPAVPISLYALTYRHSATPAAIQTLLTIVTEQAEAMLAN